MPQTKIQFHNTLSRKKEPFTPIDPQNVRVYVCGPTVYDRIHIGNARPIVVFDVLVRLLRYHYPKVTYVRNITDVDDKIIQRMREEGLRSIAELTKKTIKQFHADCKELGALRGNRICEPRAAKHIPEMIAMIKTLLKKGHAYEAEGHILFDVSSFPDYGNLSKRSVNEMKAGARVEVAPYKKSPMDFVLWKPSDADTPGWDSPLGKWHPKGRPGWHIECSAMSRKHLGEKFDIHGGGVDLVFPHHENELCQSYAAHGKQMARFWMHNGYVMQKGEKMAKSLGNSVGMARLFEEYKGEVIRLALLQTHYRKPLDFSFAILDEAKNVLDKFYRAVRATKATTNDEVDSKFLAALADDLNTPAALDRLHELVSDAVNGGLKERKTLKKSANMLGLLQNTESQWFRPKGADDDAITALITKREKARKQGDFATADKIRDELKAMNIILEDTPQGTKWRRK